MKLLSSFLYSLKQGIKGVFSNKAMSFISIISVTATLIILGVVLSVVLNINQLIKVAEDEINEVRVAVDGKLDEDSLKTLESNLLKVEGVEKVEYKSKESSFNDMKSSWGEDSYLLEGVKNPLDDFYVVTIDNPDNIKTISNKIVKLEGAGKIEYHQDIMQNFLDISNKVKKFGGLIISFLLLICLVLISNTIKSRVLSKKEEIQIIKYVGASNIFVIAPFIVEGFVIGILGAGLAVGTCVFIYSRVIQSGVTSINSIIGNSILPLSNVSSTLSLVLVATGIVVGVLGSILSVKKHLKV
ncbi:permease-like cell division protein FtsX [Romboutsia sp.]|uniref:permease-like cell division protein FtsX n=1 Tax=Romboutsia sp. TaxID=1965302 RepID=UPI003F34E39F